jgi:hypothetical protein
MAYRIRNYEITKETEKSVLIDELIWLPKSQININEEIKEIELTKFIWEQRIFQFYHYVKDDVVDMREVSEIKELSTLPVTKKESIIIKTGDGISVTAINKSDIPQEYYGERAFSSTWAKSDLKALEKYNHNYMLMHFGFYDGFRCYDLGKINVLPGGKVYYPAYNKLKATCFEQENYNIYYPKELVDLLIDKNNVTKVLSL